MRKLIENLINNIPIPKKNTVSSCNKEENKHYIMLKWLLAFHICKCHIINHHSLIYKEAITLKENLLYDIKEICHKLPNAPNINININTDTYTEAECAYIIIDYLQYHILHEVALGHIYQYKDSFAILLSLYCSSLATNIMNTHPLLHPDTETAACSDIALNVGHWSCKNPLGNFLIHYIQTTEISHRPKVFPSTLLKSNYDFIDKLIIIMYFWFADMSLTSSYDQFLEEISTSINIIDGNIPAEKLFNCILNNSWERRDRNSQADATPSKIAYYLNDLSFRENKPGYHAIKKAFTEFINKMPRNAQLITPSIITIIINTLLPSKISRAKNPQFFYENILRPIHKAKLSGARMQSKQTIKFPSKNDTSFLKMLIIPKPDIGYHKNKFNRIESRFDNYEWNLFCHIFKELYEHKNGIFKITYYDGWYKHSLTEEFSPIPQEDIEFYEQYILPLELCNNHTNIADAKLQHAFSSLKENTLDENTIQQLHQYIIKAMFNHTFPFTYDYFQIFWQIFDFKEFKFYKLDFNIAFSILHLNTFTKWYDAILLHHNMPAWGKDCYYFFYTKLLLCHPEFEDCYDAINDLSQVKSSDISSMLESCYNVAYTKHNNRSHQYKTPLFPAFVSGFNKSCSSLLNTYELLKLFAPGLKPCNSTYSNLNPIYKWIKTIEYTDTPESFYEQLEKECPISFRNVVSRPFI